LLSVVTPLFNASFGRRSSPFDTIRGIGASSTGSSEHAAIGGAAPSAGVKTTTVQPIVGTTIAAITRAAHTAKNVIQFLANPALMNVLPAANKLSDQIGCPALKRQTLTPDPGNANSCANRLTDTRWKALAHIYDSAPNGLTSFAKCHSAALIANSCDRSTFSSTTDLTSSPIQSPGLVASTFFASRKEFRPWTRFMSRPMPKPSATERRSLLAPAG
jgi:hypothetical protein